MPIRIRWDKYEITLLIDACNRVTRGESKKSIVKEISQNLRNRAISQGVEIDDLFRNENGIDLQMTKMEYLLTDGQKGLPGASKFFVEMVALMRNNPQEYAAILREATSQTNNERSGKTIMSDKRTLFVDWLNNQSKLKLPINRILSVLDESSDYAKKHGVIKTSIWEIADAKTFSAAYNKLSGNRLFRIIKKNAAQALDKVYIYYRDFLVSLETKPAEDKEVSAQPSVEEHEHKAGKDQNPDFGIKVHDTLKQLSAERQWGVSVLAIYEMIGGSLTAIKEILDNASWAEATGKTYRFVESSFNNSLVVEPSVVTDAKPTSDTSDEKRVHDINSTSNIGERTSTSRHSMDADFCAWMNKKGMSDSTVRSYSSAIRSAETFAKENDITGICLSSTDYALVLSSIDVLLANKRFIAFNIQQHNRFSAAFRKLRDYISELNRKNEQKSNDIAMEMLYPALYQKLYSISKIYEDPQGITIDHIELIIGIKEETWLRKNIIEILDCVSWATKIADGTYSFSKRAASPTITVEEVKSEKPVLSDFDNDAFIRVLMMRYQSGMEFDSIDLEIFRDTYSNLYDETLTFSDEELEQRLKLCGVMYKDRIFPADGIIDPATRERLFSYINNQFAAGKKVLYYNAIYTDLADAFAYCFSLTDEFMLKAYIEFVAEDGQYFFYENYMSKEKTAKVDHSEEVVNFMLAAGKPMSYEEVYAGLSHISKDIIYCEIHGSSRYVMNEKEHYFHIDIFEFSQADGDKIAEILNKEIDENGYAIWSRVYETIQGQMPVFLEHNLYLSSLGIRNALARFMSDRFNFEGEVISTCDVRLSMADVFRLYAKHHTPFSDTDIYDFSKEVGTSIYFWALAEESVRVSKTIFVAKDQVDIDIDAVDKALETYLSSGYILIRDVDSFLVFPNVGYEWNEYLLESFLLHYSKKYTLVNNGTSLNNVAGAIARKDGEFTRFVDICAQVLADSGIELKKVPSLNYLAEVNLITRRSYKELEIAMTKARQIRNRKG